MNLCQDLSINSPYCLLHISYHVCFKNSVVNIDWDNIFLLMIFFILISIIIFNGTLLKNKIYVNPVETLINLGDNFCKMLGNIFCFSLGD